MGAIPTLEELRAGCDELEGVELLMVLAGPGGPLHHRTALVSSFGAESAALLHMVASVDPATPVIFLDTGKHFPETLAYRDQLVDWFGLLNVINATPDQLSLAQSDRNGQLYVNDPDLCCHLRKVEPLESSLREFAAWITGRKRFQGGLRANLETIETEPSTGRLKLNPIAGWAAERIEAYRRDYGVPAHPLAKRGYRSIGCAPCTGPTAPGEPARSGRWPGLGKFECGIHRPVADLPPMPPSAVPDGSAVLGIAAALLPGPTSSRRDILTPLLNRLAGATRLEGAAEAQRWFRTIDVIVPNIDLRTVLCTDPALAALLPGCYGTIELDERAPGLRIGARGAIGLNPKLFRDPAALLAATRWGIELAEVVRVEPTARLARVEAALVYGAGLPGLNHGVLRDHLPVEVLEALSSCETGRMQQQHATAAFCALFAASGVDQRQAECAVADEDDAIRATSHWALALPLEVIIAQGGDSRLRVDPKRGLNRYGTAPHPRPEAIQFSSSTASSISDYGFLLCDEIRRRLLRESVAAPNNRSEPWEELADAIRAEISALLGVGPEQADIVLGPSGTDTEFLAVLLALGGSAGHPLTNVLIAPEETERGVALAGEGRYFDESTAAGISVTNGAPAWPALAIESHAVAIREFTGKVRPTDTIVAEVRDTVNGALAAGRHVLVHVLLGSRTGISAPPLEIVEALRRSHGDRVDVVVDACQFRVTPSLLGALARRGWMVQVSGSKFLTGPAFSAALVVPTALRARRVRVADLLAQAPAVGWSADWPAAWRQEFAPAGSSPARFGMLFRWVAALGEAQLLRAVPRTVCKTAFDRFRTRLHERLAASEVLVPLPTPDRHLADLGEEAPGLAARSIVSFALAIGDPARERRLATLDECQLLFELLNCDIVSFLDDLTPDERRLAARAMHIGQPVALRPDSPQAPTVLQLVVGARFFTIVGFPSDGDVDAAIEVEIGDAVAAIDKLELLVSRFGQLEEVRTRPAAHALAAASQSAVNVA